ncbi:hypothetical protein GT354_36090, partial [Streptomyces sp. SID3343]|nr:hypothetical protein [Streptomyces sp. SID3343]
ARGELTRAEHELADAMAEVAASTVDRVLLGHAAAVDAVHADVEAIRDAVELAADAEDEALSARERAADLLARVRPDRALDDPTAYDVPAGVGERVTALRDELKACEARLASAADKVAYRTTRHDAARAAATALVAPGDTEDLRALLKAVPGNLVDDIARDEQCERKLSREAVDLRTRHALDDVPALAGDGAARVRLPGQGRIADHVEQVTRARAELRAAADAEHELRAQLDLRSRELAALTGIDPPPTPAEWAAARAERDRLWTQICAAPPLTDDRIDEYEHAVELADDLAERIASRAEAAVKRGRLEVDVAHDGRRLVELAARRAEASERQADLDTAWAHAWQLDGLPVPDPHDASVLIDAV